MPIFCPLCNRSSDDIRFVGSFCEACVVKRLARSIPERATIKQCRFCRRIKEGKTFSKMGGKSLSRAIKIETRFKGTVKVKEYDAKGADAAFIFDVDGEEVSVPAHVSIKITHETCRRCYQISSGYYEAVVQLRGSSKRIESLVAKIEKYVQRRGGFIAKMEDVDRGRDLYVSDKIMMNQFFKDYDLKPVRSFRLFGLKYGRKIYRNTYSLHLEMPKQIGPES